MSRILFLLLFLFPAAAYAQTAVDVELVLAVDTSNSIALKELKVQRQGYADALVSTEFLTAVQDGPRKAVAVLYYEWGSGNPGITNYSGWHYITDYPSALELAVKIQNLEGIGVGGMTFMSSGVRYGFDEMNNNEYAGERLIVDVSADGRNDNSSETMLQIRQYAEYHGITINGLAIMLEREGDPQNHVGPSDDYLDKYMEECVKAGKESFVLKVRQTQDFGPVIKQKMKAEIQMVKPWNWLRIPVIGTANAAVATQCETMHSDMGGH